MAYGRLGLISKFHQLYHEFIKTGKEFSSDDYWLQTPQVGAGGKGTLDNMPEDVKKVSESPSGSARLCR